MSDIKERLDKVRALIQEPEFLEGKGLSNEVNIRIFFSTQRKNLSHAWRKPVSNGFMLWKMILWFLRLRHSRRMWQNRFVCMR